MISVTQVSVTQVFQPQAKSVTQVFQPQAKLT